MKKRDIVPSIKIKELPPLKRLERTVSFDLGFGFPNLFNVGSAIQFPRRIEFGAHLGAFPGSSVVTNLIPLPNRVVNLINGQSYVLTSNASFPNLYTLSPFFRYYPTRDTNFYLQFSYVLFRTKFNISSGISDIIGNPIPGASLSTEISFTQSLPQVSIGHWFSSGLYFVNLCLGFSMPVAISTDVSFGANIPAQLGGAQANQSTLDAEKNRMEAEIRRMYNDQKNKLFLIPSLQFTVGFMY